jgi:hypothetical protein
MGVSVMKHHIKVGIVIISIFAICLYYKIVVIDFTLLLGYIGNIAVWIARTFLAAILTSWLKK